MTTRTIKVGALARVEGEGALKVTIRDGQVKHAELNIFEPPRFFEGFLRGRAFTEAPDITARICGICPVAYQMSAVHAMEAAIGVAITPEIRALRRLLYCGEWIESHGLHVYMQHAPDFLGYPGAIELAKDFPDIVKRGLAMKKAGNEIVATVGGREIHPVNIKVGGFYKAPSKKALNGLADKLKEGRDIALETVRWVAGFDFPAVERDYEFVCLSHADEYPFNEGRIISNRGLDIDADAYPDHFEEIHMPQSTALHSRIKERGFYFCGPMARYSLNFSKLPDIAKDVAKEVGLGPVCRNPYQSIIVRSIELVFAFDEALRIIEGYAPPEPSSVEDSRESRGRPRRHRSAARHALSSLPARRRRIDRAGGDHSPTSQNQATIEEDLTTFIPQWLNMNDDDLRWRCEQTGAQLRPLHLLRHPLFEAGHRSWLNRPI